MNDAPRRYQRVVDRDSDDSLSRIARRIPAGSTVLDLGFGSGALGRYLDSEKHCRVDGIDLEPPPPEASSHYRRFLIADLERAELGVLLGAERYDAIVCADVIEHLRRPERVLEQLAALLAPAGRVLLSVPNIAHAGVLASLLAGEFRYAPEGLLDDTHVRFFTRRSLLRLLRDVGLAPRELERVVVDVNRSEFRDRLLDAMSPSLRQALLARTDALTYQFVIEAIPAVPGAPAVDDEREREAGVPELEFSSRLYWRTAHGAYTEAASITTIGVIGRAEQRLVFQIPGGLEIGGLRLDPADRPGYLRFHAIRVCDAAQERLWEWDGTLSTLEARARSQIEFAEVSSAQVVAVLTGKDPWLELGISSDTLGRLSAGGSFELEVSWPESTDYVALARRLFNETAYRSRVDELMRELTDAEAKLGASSAKMRQLQQTLDATRSEANRAAEAVTRQWGVVREQLGELSNAFAASRAWRIGDAIGELSLRLRRRPRAMLARSLEEATAKFLAPSRTSADDLPAWVAEQRAALQRFHDLAAQCINSRRYLLGRRLFRVASLLRLRFSAVAPGVKLGAAFGPAFQMLEAAQAATARSLHSTASACGQTVERVWTRPLAPHDATADLVVCVHNAPSDTRNCLSSVIENTTPPYRIIIVDDGSAEETAAFLRTFALEQGAILLRNEAARGYTFAANQGLRASSADYVVLLNSDTIVTPGWLDRVIACGESDPRIGAVGPLSNCASWQSIPRQLGPDGDWAENPLPDGMSVAEMGEWVAQHSSRAYPRLPFLNGFCYAIRRASINAIGVFDEEHFGSGFHEENDYSLRLRSAGFSLAVADDAYVHHHQSRSYSTERRKTLSERSGEMLGRLHTQAVIEQGLERLHRDLPLAGVRARQVAALESWPAHSAARRRFEGRRVACVLPERIVSSAASIVVQQAHSMRNVFGVDAMVIGLRSQEREFHRFHDGATPVQFADDLDVLVAELDDFEAGVTFGVPSAELAVRAPNLLLSACRIGRERGAAVDGAIWRQQSVTRHGSSGASPARLPFGVDTRLFAPRPCGRQDPSDEGRVKLVAALRGGQDSREVRKTIRLLEHAQVSIGERLDVLVLGCDPSSAHLASARDRRGWSIPGLLRRSELAALLSEADVFVDMSTSSSGLFALEAAASGAVCAVTRKSQAAVLLGSGVALLLDDDDDAACSAVSRLIMDQKERMRLSRRGVEEVARHGVDAGVHQLLELLFPREQ